MTHGVANSPREPFEVEFPFRDIEQGSRRRRYSKPRMDLDLVGLKDFAVNRDLWSSFPESARNSQVETVRNDVPDPVKLERRFVRDDSASEAPESPSNEVLALLKRESPETVECPVDPKPVSALYVELLEWIAVPGGKCLRSREVAALPLG